MPSTGVRVGLTADEPDIDTQYLGFTITPREDRYREARKAHSCLANTRGKSTK